MRVELLHGDCVDLMRAMPECSVDSIVTDPPYELSFMGKTWDGAGIAYSLDMWREALRVLKPGGHLLAFGGTRTYHRMACAIEDVGFEIRDSIHWVYGSGFPKSLNIGKAIDKAAGAERDVIRVATRAGNAERRGEGRQGATYGDSHGGFTELSTPVTDPRRLPGGRVGVLR
jgi:23S rRNA G2069 N7-methylase RlmK/C1962 C5-methylase RlmI